jgi:phage-related protein
MYKVVYYIRPDGTAPVRDWIAGLDNTIHPSIRAKIERLKEHGPKLKGTNSFEYIPGPDNELWELRDVGWGWRIVTYHDLNAGKFVLLHGFRKKKQKKQQADFTLARKLLHEYQELGGCSNE